MSTVPTQPPSPKLQVQIAAHQSHWYDVFQAILKAVIAGNSALAEASVIPAPVEAGITIGIISAATIAPVIEQVTNPTAPTPGS